MEKSVDPNLIADPRPTESHDFKPLRVIFRAHYAVSDKRNVFVRSDS
jgi:hypothetical protein